MRCQKMIFIKRLFHDGGYKLERKLPDNYMDMRHLQILFSN